jgi:cytochrome c biogenesis protein CcdA
MTAAASDAAALIAGAATSVGPCAVPRYLALIGVVSQHGRRRAVRARMLFYAGTLTAYVSIAFAGGCVMRLYANTMVLQLLTAGAFIIAGLAGLAVRHECAGGEEPAKASCGASFMAGAVSSLTLAPCCAPVLVALAAIAATGASPGSTALPFVMFLFGHLAPTFAIGDALGRVARSVAASGLSAAVKIVGASCTIALGIYYGIGA